MKKNKIVAVVVTYNRKDYLLLCIESLLGQDYNAFDILIIDNHSTDGTYGSISKYTDEGRVTYIDTGSNLGGAGGFAYGVREAFRRGYDYLWLMDDDSIPQKKALKELLLAGKSINGRFGFLASRVIWKDNSPCKMNIQRKTITNNLTEYKDNIERVVISSFVSLFLPARVVKRIGIPIKEFFIWTDDWEYTRRISRKYPSYAVRDSVVVHLTATNTGADISRDVHERLDRYKYAYRNEVYLYKREGLMGLMHLLLRTPVHICRVISRSPDRKLERIGIILKNTIKGLWFNPDIEYI